MVEAAGTNYLAGYRRPGAPANSEWDLAVHEAVVSCGRGSRWILGGDFNLTPDEAGFVEALRMHGGRVQAPDSPTRWRGKRVIDWYVTAPRVIVEGRPVLDKWFVAGDHLAVDLAVQSHHHREHYFWSIPKTRCFQVPNEADSWTTFFEEHWEA